MTYFISSRMTDGVISEPSPASLVSAVHPTQPPIKSYIEAATDYWVVKPSSTFTLAPPDEYVRWNTEWGSTPSSCTLRETMGQLSELYGFSDSTTWSPSCWNLGCPLPGEGYAGRADSFVPAKTKFQMY